MKILDFKTEMLGDVAGLFNRGVAGVPNCWPVEEADFAGAVAAVSGGESDGGPSVEDQALSVATHAYLSDRLDHVSALLLFNGYRLTGGEVFLNGLDYEAAGLPRVDLDFDLTVAWPRERGLRPGCRVVDWTCQLSKSLA